MFDLFLFCFWFEMYRRNLFEIKICGVDSVIQL